MNDLVASLQMFDVKAHVQVNGRWCSVMPVWPEVEHPSFLGELRKVTMWRQHVEPWMLADISQSPAFVVCGDFTWLNRIRAWWLNLDRKAKAKQHAEFIAKRLEQGEQPMQWLSDRQMFAPDKRETPRA